MEITDILVPVDFVSSSVKSLEYALSLAAPDGEIYLLHVIDADFVEKAARNELGSAEALTEKLRHLAERELDEIIAQNSEVGNKLNKMIVVGIPFIEILRIANDLDFSLIVMGIRGKKRSHKRDLLRKHCRQDASSNPHPDSLRSPMIDSPLVLSGPSRLLKSVHRRFIQKN